MSSVTFCSSCFGGSDCKFVSPPARPQTYVMALAPPAACPYAMPLAPCLVAILVDANVSEDFKEFLSQNSVLSVEDYVIAARSSPKFVDVDLIDAAGKIFTISEKIAIRKIMVHGRGNRPEAQGYWSVGLLRHQCDNLRRRCSFFA